MYEKLKQLKEVKIRLEKELGRKPTKEEVELEFGENIDKLEQHKIDEESEEDMELRFKIGVSNNNLRKAREEKNLLQQEIANKLDIGSQSYGQIERCYIYPKKKLQTKISEILDKPTSYLFPKWLILFSKQWKKQEKEKLVIVKHEQLKGAEYKQLPTCEDIYRDVNNKMNKKTIMKVMAELTPREKKILEMRFGLVDGDAHTLEEVAQEFGVIRERIRQIESKALEKLGESDLIKDLV